MKFVIVALFLFFTTSAFAQRWTPYLTKLEAQRWSKFECLARTVEQHHPKIPHGFLRASSWRETKHQDTTRVEGVLFNVGEPGANLVIQTSRKFVENHPAFELPLTIERLQEATSYHKHQILGLNYRLYGDTTKFLAQISDSVEFEFTCQFMEDNIRRYGNFADAVAAYNGGNRAVKRKRKTGRYSNQPYVNEVLGNTKRFSY